ncbi:hypothetical protein C8R43DRAFT_1016690 [Mycena crocata]|nr:hypothetical protein C8R43DRAFT_1016690 [Mycena crocata]
MIFNQFSCVLILTSPGSSFPLFRDPHASGSKSSYFPHEQPLSYLPSRTKWRVNDTQQMARWRGCLWAPLLHLTLSKSPPGTETALGGKSDPDTRIYLSWN